MGTESLQEPSNVIMETRQDVHQVVSLMLVIRVQTLQDKFLSVALSVEIQSE